MSLATLVSSLAFPPPTFIGPAVLEGTLSPQRTSLSAISGTPSSALAGSWKVELPGIFPKIGIWGRGPYPVAK